MSIPFKPRGSDARRLLKQFKEEFDMPGLNKAERLIEWAVLHGPVKAMQAYSGEFLHQLALRSERRGEAKRAERLFVQSENKLQGNALGLARTLRDHGLFVVMHGKNPLAGIGMIEQALSLHEEDLGNAKGRRQQLITQSKLWRAHMVRGDSKASSSREMLTELALGQDFATFHFRDRGFIVDFLIPYTKGKTRRQLLARRAAIHAERGQPRRAAENYLKLLVDIELSIAGTIVRRIFRRE